MERIAKRLGKGLPETYFRYHQLVVGEVDRVAWAIVVQELLDLEAAPIEPGGKTRTHGAKTRFAAKVGLKTARTIDTWLAKQVDVKEASVRGVAQAYHVNAMDLLIRVGFYTAEQLPVRTAEEVVDDEIAIVLDSDLDDEVKMMIIQELEKWRAEDREMQERLAQRDKARRISQLRARIEQARQSA